MKTRDHQLLSHTVVALFTARARALMGTCRWHQGTLILSFAHLFARSHSFPCTHALRWYSSSSHNKVYLDIKDIVYVIDSDALPYIPFMRQVHSCTFLCRALAHTHAERPIQNASWIPAVSHWRNTPNARSEKKIHENQKETNHTPLCDIIEFIIDSHWERRCSYNTKDIHDTIETHLCFLTQKKKRKTFALIKSQA